MKFFKKKIYIFFATLILAFSFFTSSCQFTLIPIKTVNASSSTEQKPESTPTPSLSSSITPTITPSEQSNDIETETASGVKFVAYTGKVTHIFFHPLLAYPEMAFDGDSQSYGFDEWFVTVSEFNKIIDSLYKKNYILIDINSLYNIKTTNNNTIITKKTLMLPENKKPLILSIDDMNYYKYMIGNGTVSKLILDSEGNIATYSKNSKGENVISYDNEIIPIVDKFVKEHPDFSMNGAKGTIALTGYEGVLGYRTDFDTLNNASERAEALKVIARLKETGWNFACHGYGHLDARKQPYNVIVKDTLKWKKEVESLTGPTNIYIYPFGSSLKADDPKYKFLVDSGFGILCGVGPALDESLNGSSVTMYRRHIDGLALRHQRSLNIDLYDSIQVLDPSRPKFK